MSEGAPILLRDARDEDADGLIALLGGVFAEYPNCILDVDGEMPELRALATTFRAAGGRAWVAEREGRVVGSIGFTPAGEGLEVRKLYLESGLRGSGLGDRLHDLVLAEAAARGAAFVELWSDTRFERAHRFYERRGYVRAAETRELHDRSFTVEHFFRLTLPRPGPT